MQRCKNFNLQSDSKHLLNIDGKKLNARDAWSYIIIKYANYNINFLKKCDDGKIKFEMNAGLSRDGKTGNFLQLIKNLLKINKWEDIINHLIIDIKDNTIKGIGVIQIKHSEYKDIVIHCVPGHYYMELLPENMEEINYVNIEEEKQKKIELLLNKDITIKNYLWIDFDSNLLVEYINKKEIQIELKIKLFELSLTNKYDSDMRRRIIIDVDDKYFDTIIELFKLIKLIKKQNEYTYSSNDFEFVRKLENLTHLNSNIKNIKITSIDLTPLSNLTTIGNSFMFNCYSLKSIDLTPLSNLSTIGNSFMHNCNNLKNIDLSRLSKLTTIGNSFMRNCNNL